MDREKVIKGLKHCLSIDSPCGDCPYYSYDDIQELECERNLRNDAIALLKEQETVEYALEVLRKAGWKETQDVPFPVELLKEQEAVEPKEATDPNESHWNCGACGYPLWEDENYCAHCGKRVLWEGR